jgi:hypothetical protein
MARAISISSWAAGTFTTVAWLSGRMGVLQPVQPPVVGSFSADVGTLVFQNASYASGAN